MSPPPAFRDTDFRIVARQFAEVAGFPLVARVTNRLTDHLERVDLTFFGLAEKAFEDPDFPERLVRASAQWLTRCPCETTRAVAAYAAYLREDYARASTLLMGCIVDNPENLDNWVDLAFAFNHQAIPLGRHILFNHDEYIRRFVARGSRICTQARLEEMAREIDAEGTGYQTRWFDFIKPAPSEA